MEKQSQNTTTPEQPILTGALPDRMVLVEGGTFIMGSDDAEAWSQLQPVHQVKLDGFHIGKYPVTQALWKAVMGEQNNPSFFQGDTRPVEMVSWADTQDFLQKLNRLTGKLYRLPTEAEWEYAARGGQKSRGYKYAGGNKLKEVGWYGGNSHEETKAVGQKKPNELELYDMSGNVYEWCYNWFDHWYYQQCKKQSVVANPQGSKRGSNRVLRGGHYGDDAVYCRSAFRISAEPVNRVNRIGFRLALSLQSVG